MWYFSKFPNEIHSSFLEKDLDPIKIQKTWSAIRIWNCCVQFLTMSGEKLFFDRFFKSIALFAFSKSKCTYWSSTYIHGQELNATVPDPDRTPIFLDLGRI